jgi:hypothetical protein
MDLFEVRKRGFDLGVDLRQREALRLDLVIEGFAAGAAVYRPARYGSASYQRPTCGPR